MAMEDRRKPAVCRALLLVLLIVASSAAVSTAHPERCWKPDDHHFYCVEEDCKGTCKDHGYLDGRCVWLKWCQCLLADCK